MDVTRFLRELESDPGYAGQICHVHTEPAGAPCRVPLCAGLHPGVEQFAAALGVTSLYSHQAMAIDAALGGLDVLVTTGPASGKSLCFQIPILQALLSDPDSTALLIAPAKALARDQVAAWNRGLDGIRIPDHAAGVAAVPFDADVSRYGRRKAQDSARLLVTNPEMVHVNLLPRHGAWGRFLRGLRFVVLDELHVFTGFFGANMANVVRRLDRLCTQYGAHPQFLCVSATLGNPKEVADRLTGRDMRHILQDGSGAGSRTYVFWNPPKIKSRDWRGRRSANVEAHELLSRLIQGGVPTICFSKARNTAEMIYRYVRESLQKESPALVDRVIPYRGGYSAEERRDMERRLREGELLGVSTTRALELGIDVGTLDASIIVGYPGVLNAFFQQAGRAGRTGRDSLCILIGTDTAINQYVMQHPEHIFGRPIERAVVDRDNPFVVIGHLRCAAAELPLVETDEARFGYASRFVLEALEEKRQVHRVGGTWYHSAADQPSRQVRLRGWGDESTVVQDADSGEVMDKLDKFRALRIFYPGAIYFHLGDTYEVVHHDFDRNVVRVRRTDVPYYTDPVTGTAVDHIDAILDQRPLGSGQACLGEVFAVSRTEVYERVRFYTLDRISQHKTSVPPIAYEAMSFWVSTPPDLPIEAAKLGLNPESGMRGILYCTSRVLPLFLTSDSNDFDWSLGCRNSPWHTMFWFEFYLHGIGHAEQCYQRLEDILSLTLEHLLTCDCEDGCPNCTARLITPYHVRNIELGEGLVHSRRAAAVILNSLLNQQSVEESLRLLDADGRKRGPSMLPVAMDRNWSAEPHTMPLDERLRELLLRKVDRCAAPKLPVDHPIDPVPVVGIPTAARPAVEGPGAAPPRPAPPPQRPKGQLLSGKLRATLDDLSRRARKGRSQP